MSIELDRKEVRLRKELQEAACEEVDAIWHLNKGHYLQLAELVMLIKNPAREQLQRLMSQHWKRMSEVQGSSHNHQNWKGGYLDHIVETMNIACKMYSAFVDNREMGFLLSDALVVLFLHDLEKTFKTGNILTECTCPTAINCGCTVLDATKENRKKFRDQMIGKFGIRLTDDQKNALKYVEGVPDSEYTPSERIMGPMAAFCHMADIASSRIWFDKGETKSW